MGETRMAAFQISKLLFPAVSIAVLVILVWYLQTYAINEAFAVSSAQRSCELAFQTCMRNAILPEDARICNTVYSNCMSAANPVAPTASPLPSYSSGVQGRDETGARRVIVPADTTDSEEAKRQYQILASQALNASGSTTSPRLGPIGGSSLIGFNEIGTFPTQANLDTAQSIDFTTAQQQQQDMTGPLAITTTSPPAGLTDSVKQQIRRDTVEAVKEELQKIFSENRYLYQLQD